LLEFAEGRPVGRRGIEWLHIQIANSAGFDKASLSDRQQYTKDHLDEVMDSADRPLDGNRWWLKADDPWQCLAACMELTNALRAPNPEEFISHLPVQQDGTCNGLQHYAALGGDKTGAQQVNLAAGDKPADVYTAVANLVNVELDKDVASGEALRAQMDRQQKDSRGSMNWNDENVLRLADVASVLKGKVTRKVVKQTVMTTVYGVTFIGAKRQIHRQLRDRGDIPSEWQYGAASYLAEKVLTSIGDLFKGASSIQLWLSVCARLIGKSVQPQEGISLTEQFKHPMASVIWTTPLGLPVAQPYRQKSKSQINTALQSVYISDPNKPTPVDPRAQATGFPPNYVHSLDATHMMMTAIECEVSSLMQSMQQISM
jgi:DNA-directed RNA polymerase